MVKQWLVCLDLIGLKYPLREFGKTKVVIRCWMV